MKNRTTNLAALLSPLELIAARDWISDCVWGDLDADDIRQLSAEQVARGVQRYFDGGIYSFKLSQLPAQKSA